MTCAMPLAKRRVMRCSSPWLIVVGSTAMPPLAPPNGTSSSAVFHVISDARARTSSRSAVGVVADAALVRAAGAVVLHPVALGDDEVAVVEADRDLHRDLAVGGA